jgi:ribosome-associated heat shock protein Hsp15
MTGVRMDKWLWAARFFKTRAFASHACDLGRIQSNEVHPGDHLQIMNDSGDYLVEVLAVSDMRGPAAVAQTLRRESDESRELRLKLAEEQKAMLAAGELPASKPSKRDRREIDRFCGRS